MHRGMPVNLFALAAILASTVLASSLGCARKPDDAKISSEIQSKYGQDSGLSSKQLAVQASNGIVTLSGFVDNEAQRAAAARQAGTVEGVKEVINNLQVGSPNTPVAAGRVSNVAGARPATSVASATSPRVRKSSHSRATEDANNLAPSSDNTAAGDSQPSDPQDGTSAGSSPPVDFSVRSAPDMIPAPAAPPQPVKVTIEQGTPMSVRLIDSIDTGKNQIGDTFHASLSAPLSAEGSEAIPAGTDVVGHIVDLKNASKFAGQSLVVLQLDSIVANGKTYTLQTNQFRKEGSSRGKNTAEKVGGGAILGGIIGALAGGGKGAAIGTAAGAGVGGGAQAASKSQQIKLPSETVLNFTLQAPVTVIKPPDANAGRQKLVSAQ